VAGWLLAWSQAFGQALWCLAHTLWVGNSFMVATSLGLMAHHAFGCWHGDRRLADKYGEAFEKVRVSAWTQQRGVADSAHKACVMREVWRSGGGCRASPHTGRAMSLSDKN
jgi:hypothetical protein